MSILNDINNVLQVWSDPVPAGYDPVFEDFPLGHLIFTREGQTVTVDITIDNVAAVQASGSVPWPEQGFLEVDSLNGSYFTIYNGSWTLSKGGSTEPLSWVATYTTTDPPAPDPGPGTQVSVYTGYAPTGAQLPYLVTRPLDIGTDTELNLDGSTVDWNTQISVYCCAASVEASFNLALAVIGTLQGARAGGTTLSASMGYNGAQVEGHYESQVTVQSFQGGIS